MNPIYVNQTHSLTHTHSPFLSHTISLSLSISLSIYFPSRARSLSLSFSLISQIHFQTITFINLSLSHTFFLITSALTLSPYFILCRSHSQFFLISLSFSLLSVLSLSFSLALSLPRSLLFHLRHSELRKAFKL